MNDGQLIHKAGFVWDDGQGEAICSAAYLETRCLQRVALGKAAEAHLNHDEGLAADYESKARTLAHRLDDMRRAGHVGKNIRYSAGEFREKFRSATAATLCII